SALRRTHSRLSSIVRPRGDGNPSTTRRSGSPAACASIDRRRMNRTVYRWFAGFAGFAGFARVYLPILMNRAAIRIVSMALAALWTVAGAAAAQPRTGTISGVVTGDDGNHLPGVTVTIENAATGTRRSATTDAEGRYAVPDLPVDVEYLVR